MVFHRRCWQEHVTISSEWRTPRNCAARENNQFTRLIGQSEESTEEAEQFEHTTRRFTPTSQRLRDSNQCSHLQDNWPQVSKNNHNFVFNLFW